MKQEVRLNGRVLLISTLLYIYIPIILFLFTWTRLPIAVLTALCLCYAAHRMYLGYREAGKNEISMRWGVAAVLVLLTLLLGYYLGWGRFTMQTGDWKKHNALLADLVRYNWPVYYQNGSEHSMLTYYIAQYLVPGFAGKVFQSFRAAEIVNYLWSATGMILVSFHFIRVVNAVSGKKQIISWFLLVLYSGPLVLAQWLLKLLNPDLNMLGNPSWFLMEGDKLLQYSSNWTLLRWVHPQSIVMWLIVLLFVEHRKQIQHYVVLMLPGLLYGSLSFLGMLPLATGYALVCLAEEKQLKVWIKQIFSISNCITAVSPGGVLVLYFYGNVLAEKPDGIGLSAVDYGGRGYIYVLFCISMFLLYTLIICRDFKKDAVFWMANGILLLLPYFKMGMYNDLGMRCSIPALFIMTIYVGKYVNQHFGKGFFVRQDGLRRRGLSAALIVLLGIGSFYTLQDFYTVVRTDQIRELADENNYGGLEQFANRFSDNPVDLVYNYYSYDIENNIFYRYIARRGSSLQKNG